MNSEEECLKMDGVVLLRKQGGIVLNRIDWSVRKQEHILIMGNAGSGRKELYELLAEHKVPIEGRIQIQGKWAFISEEFPTLEGLSVMDYLRLIMDSTGTVWKKERMEKLLRLYGLWTKREYPGNFLCMESQIRLMFALAEVVEPDVIVMEPCWQYLEGQKEREFTAFIAERIEKMQITVICFSDKRYMDADKLSDDIFELQEKSFFSQIFVLENGGIKMVGKENGNETDDKKIS